MKIKGQILKVILFITFLIPLFAITGCFFDEPISPNNLPPDNVNKYDTLTFSNKIQLLSYPTFGSINTTFKFNLVLKDSTLKISKIKYDLTYDHIYDSTFTENDTLKTEFKLYGYNTIIASAFLEDNTVISCSTLVWLTEPKLILSDNNVFYEPNIYNGKKISVTHGPGHLIQFLDFNTFLINKYFEGFPSNPFNELHVSVPSFDGNKVLFSYFLRKVAYYDFVKNDSTITVPPLNTTSYQVGQITWSLDSKSIYYVATEGTYDPVGIKSYNLETNQINTLYNSGEFICVVPDQPDKLAILEKVDDTKSKLLILNINTKTVEKEYDNIPFHTPFRMLSDNDRIYVDGQLAFYSLSQQKLLHMQFDELDLTQHSYGEADITMDGSYFVITTWHSKRGIYLITLPNYF